MFLECSRIDSVFVSSLLTCVFFFIDELSLFILRNVNSQCCFDFGFVGDIVCVFVLISMSLLNFFFMSCVDFFISVCVLLKPIQNLVMSFSFPFLF